MSTPGARASDEAPDPSQPADAPRARIRAAQPDDAWAISALLAACAPRCVALSPLAVLGAIDEWFVMAGAHGSVLGSLRLAERGGATEVGGVAVDRRARGRGVGAALLRHALARQRERGLDLVCITCEPDYFERFGFEAQAGAPPPRTGPSPAPDASRVRMRRRAHAPAT